MAALSLAVILAAGPCSGKRFEPYLPSIFGSSSGATKPMKRSELVHNSQVGGGGGVNPGQAGGGYDGKIHARKKGMDGAAPSYRDPLAGVCGDAGKPWRPFGHSRGGARRRLSAWDEGGADAYAPGAQGENTTSGGAAGGDAGGGEGLGGGRGGSGRRRRLLQRAGQAGFNALVSDADAEIRSNVRRQVARAQTGAGEAGFNGLDKYCALEKRSSGGLTSDEKMLASCLRSGARCDHDPARVAAAANSLRGMVMLSKRPRCMMTNKASCPSSLGNAETGLEFLSTKLIDRAKAVGGGRPWEAPPRDLGWRAFKRCAIVGNGPSLQTYPNGKVIDDFDAVFRFNDIGGKDPLASHTRHMGHKTTFRVFARKPSYDLAEGTLRIRPKGDEKWLFWHAHSRMILPGISKKIKEANLRMFSPAQIRWQLEVYFQLRRDMRRLGFGPWSCPRNINSGLHAILVGQHLCDGVATFGISHLQRMAQSGAHFGDSKHPMSRFHSWGFDTLMMRILHMAGKIRICG